MKAPMKPEDENSNELTCPRDETTVPADDPRCLHPSSLCEFREFCEIIDAMSRKRRAEANDAEAAE